eukprot:CAMPEP_0114236556 /NCGR_PEP_ID=MMETSP0058-20121206/6905_1 /TAXON_ID=36894 /ORGANISM="Pyramimonas parkeae, CCMP726" /LENGTH=53 /DNA_ID=CAMNT_0001348509 /DNA_START=180 /DNA_END=341 /DNA_ORIENTATION=+
MHKEQSFIQKANALTDAVHMEQIDTNIFAAIGVNSRFPVDEYLIVSYSSGRTN